ncbi:hypothetical protein P4J26_32075, partial [Bacillus cereus]|nr:hypothetical protein [Bacillus cereus]
MVVKINIEKQVQHFLAYITEKRTNVDGIAEDLLQIAKRKKQLFQKRNAEIVKATADVSFMRQLNNSRIIGDYAIEVPETVGMSETLEREVTKEKYGSYQYNRLEAVKYA